MKKRAANKEKSEKVKAERGFSPEEVVTGGELLGVKENPKYPKQHLEIYWFENYVWVVVVESKDDRLVTAYQSRKYKEEFGK